MNNVTRRLALRRLRLTAWLKAQPEFAQLPGLREDVSEAQHALLVTVGRRMVDAGLYSEHTLARDRHRGIRTLVTAARKRVNVS